MAEDIQEALADNDVPFDSEICSFMHNVALDMGDNVHRYVHSALSSGTPSSHSTGGRRFPTLASGYIHRGVQAPCRFPTLAIEVRHMDGHFDGHRPATSM